MTTTDAGAAQRLAALEARRAASKEGRRRRPAARSRILAAGAGTAAVLTMVASMARADQAVPAVEAPIAQTQALSAPSTPEAGPTSSPDTFRALPEQQSTVQTITVTRPARSVVANARTSASR